MNAELYLDGLLYGGWKEVDCTRSIEQVAGVFKIELTAAYPGFNAPLEIREGMPCQLRLDGEAVVTGYIDDVVIEYTDTTSMLRIEGRDKTADLVDCAAIVSGGQWRNVGLDKIVREIAQPFGIQVVADTDLGKPFKSFALEEGERAFDAIDRACRMRGVLSVSNPQGNLLLTRASQISSGVQLREGLNLQRFGATHSWRERHSQYILKGQTAADDESYGAVAVHQKAIVNDAEITRYRPLIVLAEHGTDVASLRERARWEALVRMGRGKRGTCTVVGWRSGKEGQDGELWRPNTLVYVESERMRLARDMLIVACNYTLSEAGGKVTNLTFARREAFELVAGMGRSRLGYRLNNKTENEKKQKGDKFEILLDDSKPNVVSPRP